VTNDPSRTLTAEETELLDQLFGQYYQECFVTELDPILQVDWLIIGEIERDDGRRLTSALGKLVDLVPSENGLLERRYGTPESRDRLLFLGALQHRADQLRRGERTPRELPYENVSGFEPPRTSRWAAHDMTAAAVEVVRADLDAWMTEPAGSTWYRHHYLVDLGEVVGEVAPLLHHELGHEVLWEQAITTSVVSFGVERQVRRVGPAPASERDLGTWRVVYARPELPLEPVVRQRFPDLTYLFGGYYGQPFDDEHGWPMWMTSQAMSRTSGQARGRMRDQLGQLLAIGSDEELIATVGHLGSYCLPYFMRHWVDRLLWKLDALDWGAPPMPRDD